MRDLLFFLLEWSMMATIFLGLYHLVSRLFKKRISRSCRYLLCLLVVCRMVIPFGLDLPGESIRTWVQAQKSLKEADVVTQRKPELTIGAAQVWEEEFLAPEDQEVAEESNQSLIGKTEVVGAMGIGATDSEGGDFGTPSQNQNAGNLKLGNLPVTGTTVFFGIWILGAIGFFLHQEISYLRWKREIQKHCEDVEVEDDVFFEQLYPGAMVELLQSENIHTPLLCGILFPCILLPKGGYVRQGKTETLKNILHHEMYHEKRKDLLWKHLCIVGRSIHWFNPLLHTMSAELNRCCELSCDAGVTKNMDAGSIRSYGETILRLAASGSFTEHVLSNGFCREKEELKERLEGIMDNRNVKGRVLALSLALTLLMSGCGTVLAPDQGVLADTVGALLDSSEGENVSEGEAGQEQGDQIDAAEAAENASNVDTTQNAGTDTPDSEQPESQTEETLTEQERLAQEEARRAEEERLELEQMWVTKAQDILLPGMQQMYYKYQNTYGNPSYKKIISIRIMAAGQETELVVWNLDSTKNEWISDPDSDWDYNEYSMYQDVTAEDIPYNIHKVAILAAASLDHLYELTGYRNDRYTVDWSERWGNLSFSVKEGDPDITSFFFMRFSHRYSEELLGENVAERYISSMGLVVSERDDKSPISWKDLKVPEDLEDMTAEEAALWYYENFLICEPDEVSTVMVTDVNMGEGVNVEVYTTGGEAYYIHVLDDNEFVSIYGPYPGRSYNNWIEAPEGLEDTFND